MVATSEALAATASIILAMGALGTAAFGLVDALKSLWGGVSRVGFGAIERALKPFAPALEHASKDWRATLFAAWLNGVPKDDQKAAARNLIRLGLSQKTAEALAKAGHVDEAAFQKVITDLEQGNPCSPQELQLVSRFNAVVDAALDAGYERADQAYRNVSKLLAGIVATALSVWAGYLLHDGGVADTGPVTTGNAGWLGWSILVGLLSVPMAPIAKDLASSLQTAAKAVGSGR